MKERKLIKDYLFFQEGPGVRNTEYTLDGVKLLNVANLVDGKLVLENTSRYISEEEAYGKYSHFLVDAGDLIIASSGIKVEYFDKKMGFAKEEHLPLCMNTSTIRFKSLNENELNIKYFMYFLKSQDFKKQLFQHITGSAQLNFGPSHLKKMNFILTDIESQNRIVDELDTISQAIDNRENQLKDYDKITDNYLENIIKSEEKEDRLGNHLSIVRGASPRPISKFITDGPGVNWIKIGDATEEDLYINSTAQKITEDGAEKSRRVYVGDLILSNSMSFGRPYILNIDGCVHDGWLILKDYEKDFNKIFICKYLGSRNIYSKFKSMATGGVVNNLNSDMVRNLNVVIPSMEAQNEFEQLVLMIEKQKDIIKKDIKDLKNMMASKMHEYFD